jgi:hypothetical protein
LSSNPCPFSQYIRLLERERERERERDPHSLQLSNTFSGWFLFLTGLPPKIGEAIVCVYVFLTVDLPSFNPMRMYVCMYCMFCAVSDWWQEEWSGFWWETSLSTARSSELTVKSSNRVVSV